MEPEKKVAKQPETTVHLNQGLIDAEAMSEEEYLAQLPELERLLQKDIAAELSALEAQPATPSNSLRTVSEN